MAEKILPARAREAKALLEGDVMVEVWERVEAVFVKEWKTADSTERREMAHAKTVGLAEVRRQLRAILGDGEYGSRD